MGFSAGFWGAPGGPLTFPQVPLVVLHYAGWLWGWALRGLTGDMVWGPQDFPLLCPCSLLGPGLGRMHPFPLHPVASSSRAPLYLGPSVRCAPSLSFAIAVPSPDSCPHVFTLMSENLKQSLTHSSCSENALGRSSSPGVLPRGRSWEWVLRAV